MRTIPLSILPTKLFQFCPQNNIKITLTQQIKPLQNLQHSNKNIPNTSTHLASWSNICPYVLALDNPPNSKNENMLIV